MYEIDTCRPRSQRTGKSKHWRNIYGPDLGNRWASDKNKRGYADAPDIYENFEFSQRNKPLKAMIGVALLVALALILARMHPVPHEIPAPPSIAAPTN